MLLTNEGGLNTGKPRKQETLIRNLANIFFLLYCFQRQSGLIVFRQ